MHQLSQELQEKITTFVHDKIPDGNWESVSGTLCHLIANGKIISEKDISYSEDGEIRKIKGIEVRDGAIQIKEKKKPLVAKVETQNEPIPFIEQLRNRRRLVPT